MKKLLMIDDEISILENFSEYFQGSEYEVYLAGCGEIGWELFQQQTPDVVIVDLFLPDINGWEVIRRIKNFKRQQISKIIVITGKSNTKNELLALEMADDYVPKPFEFDILEARINHVYTYHTYPTQKRYFYTKNICIDYDAKTVKINGENIKLSFLEYQILELLSKNADKYLSYDFIIKNVNFLKKISDIDSLRVEINRIRKKIEIEPNHPEIITCTKNMGYILHSIK